MVAAEEVAILVIAFAYFVVTSAMELPSFKLKPDPWAPRTCHQKNLLFLLCELLLSALSVGALFVDSISNPLCSCLGGDSVTRSLAIVAFLSKFAQFIDVPLVQSLGAPTTLYFRVHHALMPVAAWAVLRYEMPVTYFFVTSNAVLHIFANLYFLKPDAPFQTFVVWPWFVALQAFHLGGTALIACGTWLQMPFGCTLCSSDQTSEALAWNGVLGGIYLAFIVLFCRDLLSREQRHEEKAKRKKHNNK